MTETETSVGSILAELRQVLDDKDRVNAELSSISERERSLRGALLDYHKASGVEKVAAEGLNVSFVEKMRAKYDPEQWASIHRWFVEQGYGDCIHRRLTDSKIEDLAVHGVALPAGLTLESYIDVSTRRK